MRIYYFARTGRSKTIAEQLAEHYGTTARLIDDHKNWNGTKEPSLCPTGGKNVCGGSCRENVTAIVTSQGSQLKDRDGFRRVIDLVGKKITAPDSIE